MTSLLEGINQVQEPQNKTQIQIGIGIATGQVIAGYTVTHYRATYTCVGDTVNHLASRIESHARVVPHSILMDQYTQEGLPQDIECESLGPVVFKGKQQPIRAFTIKPNLD